MFVSSRREKATEGKRDRSQVVVLLFFERMERVSWTRCKENVLTQETTGHGDSHGGGGIRPGGVGLSDSLSIGSEGDSVVTLGDASGWEDWSAKPFHKGTVRKVLLVALVK